MKLPWKNSGGKKLAIGRHVFATEQPARRIAYEVVGRLKIFITMPLHEQVEPFRIHMRCDSIYDIIIKAEKGFSDDLLSKIQKVWLQVEPNVSFDYGLVINIHRKKYGK